jgi:N-methyl-L-tryptophan oxidase
MNHMKTYDVIIAGAGSMGMAAGYYLSKQGVKTLLIDAHTPPHNLGSHHGSTRIIRHAYGEGQQYVPLVLRAQQLWQELEQERNLQLFLQTGVLGVGDPSSAFMTETLQSAKRFSLPVERLTADDIRHRWPGIRIPDHFIACLEPNSGVLWSEKCIQAYKELIALHQGEILCETKIQHLHIQNEGVTVETNNGSFGADKLIVTAGAWTGKLLSDLELHLQPLRTTFGWFEAEETLYNQHVFPAFVFSLSSGQYYGFPSINGAGIKLGRHDGGQETDPDQVNRDFGAFEEDEQELRSFLDSYMPQASGKLKDGQVCFYTKTPDEHFIIDQHPNHDHVFIAAGFSGHGFKFCSVVGEILSDLIKDGKTRHDISMFKLAREALQG